jgi:hypothetical protein
MTHFCEESGCWSCPGSFKCHLQPKNVNLFLSEPLVVSLSPPTFVEQALSHGRIQHFLQLIQIGWFSHCNDRVANV